MDAIRRRPNEDFVRVRRDASDASPAPFASWPRRNRRLRTSSSSARDIRSNARSAYRRRANKGDPASACRARARRSASAIPSGSANVSRHRDRERRSGVLVLGADRDVGTLGASPCARSRDRLGGSRSPFEVPSAPRACSQRRSRAAPPARVPAGCAHKTSRHLSKSHRHSSVTRCVSAPTASAMANNGRIAIVRGLRTPFTKGGTALKNLRTVDLATSSSRADAALRALAEGVGICITARSCRTLDWLNIAREVVLRSGLRRTSMRSASRAPAPPAAAMTSARPRSPPGSTTSRSLAAPTA